MAFTGFNFRATLAGPTGFTGDLPNDIWVGNTGNSYKSVANGGTGYGWVGGSAFMSNGSASYDSRLGGDAFINSSPKYRIDVANGTYDIRLAVGPTGGAPGVTYCRFRVGSGSVAGTDYYDVTNATLINNTQSLDAMGTVWLNTQWPALNVPRRVTVTQGFISVELGTSSSFPRHIAYQQAASTLVDIPLTDDTGVAGTTPMLFEGQPSGKLVAKAVQLIGGPSNTSLSVCEADGVTPSQYLTIATINNEQWIVHKNVRFPDMGGTYNFVLVQSDTSGIAIYTNSPYKQAIAMPVTAAPGKPFGGTDLMSRITSGCWLARKNIVDKMMRPFTGDINTSGLWPGYQNQTIDYSTTVYNLSTLRSQVDAYQVMAQTSHNKVYCVELDTNGTSDWDVHELVAQYPVWDFFPENGNVMLIRYKAGGARPLLKGGWLIGMFRGVHIKDLVWSPDGSALSYTGAYTSSQVGNGIQFYPNPNTNFAPNNGGKTQYGRLQILKLEGVKCGLKFDPQYAAVTPLNADTNPTTTKMKGGFAIGSNNLCGEQFILKDCVLWGINAALTPFAHYLMYIENVDCIMSMSDLLGTNSIHPDFAQWYPGGKLDVYEWINGLHQRAVVDVVDSTGNAIHADYHQQRSTTGFTTPGISFRLWENNVINQSFNSPGIARENWINSSVAPQATVFINNLAVSYAPRGIESGYGPNTIQYVEYNTLGVPYKMPLGASAKAGQYIYGSNSSGSVVKTYKNIYSAGDNVTIQFPNEQNVVYGFALTRPWPPNTIMQGPFEDDPTQPGRVRAVAWDDDPGNGVTLNQFKKKIMDIHKQLPGVDAGAQFVPIVMDPGETDTSLTKTQAATLAVDNFRRAPAAQTKDVTLRWGGGQGVDVNVTVTS